MNSFLPVNIRALAERNYPFRAAAESVDWGVCSAFGILVVIGRRV